LINQIPTERNMGNISEVKTVFTVDLTPFVDGLKTMLSMTATTGQQLKPLLSVDAKIPNYSGLETQLKALSERTKEYLKANQDTAASEQQHEEKTNKASAAVEKKSTSLRGMKREALESFGAISFLATSVVNLSSKLSGGNKDFDKLSQGMSQGISAGFGLAGIMSMLGIATGGVAVAIGVVVAVGVALLDYFDDSAEKAKAASIAMDVYTGKLRGANLSQLESELKKLQAIDVTKSWFADNPEELTQRIEKVRSMITGMRKSQLEVDKYIQQAEVDSTIDKFDQQRKAAGLAYRLEQDEWVGQSNALLAAKKKYNVELKKISQDEAQFNQQLAGERFESDLNRIRQDGISKGIAQEQIDLSILQAQDNHYRAQYQKLAALGNKASSEQIQQKIQLETRLSQISLQEAEKRMAVSQREFEKKMQTADYGYRKIIANFKKESYERYDSTEKLNVDLIEIEQAYTEAVLDQYYARVASGETFNEQEKAKMLELQTRLTELSAEGTQARIDLAAREKEQTIAAIAGIGQALADMTQSMLDMKTDETSKVISSEKKQRESALEEEKKKTLSHAKTAKEREKIEAEYARKKESLDAEMNEKAKAMNADAFAAHKALAIVNATISTYEAASKALTAAPPPWNFILAAAVTAAGIANVAAIGAQEVPGYAKGGELPKGQWGYIEGIHDEVIAPKKDLLTTLREILLPEINVANSRNEVIATPQAFVQTLKNVFLPGINKETLSAPSYLRRQEMREVVAETMRTQIELSSQAGDTPGGINSKNVLQFIFSPQNYYGDDQHFEKVLKPKIEQAMTKQGASSVTELFVNRRKQTNA
jgi:hypothetical protein